MSDQLPDRLSVNPDSPFYDAEVLARDIGIRFKGVEKTNVEEYCVSEGWVKVAAGAAKDRFGRQMTITLKGPVEPYIRGEAQEGVGVGGERAVDVERRVEGTAVVAARTDGPRVVGRPRVRRGGAGGGGYHGFGAWGIAGSG